MKKSIHQCIHCGRWSSFPLILSEGTTSHRQTHPFDRCASSKQEPYASRKILLKLAIIINYNRKRVCWIIDSFRQELTTTIHGLWNWKNQGTCMGSITVWRICIDKKKHTNTMYSKMHCHFLDERRSAEAFTSSVVNFRHFTSVAFTYFSNNSVWVSCFLCSESVYKRFVLSSSVIRGEC